MFLSFFFQAEDGIRDIGVTGVQTCALPISSMALAPILIDYRPGANAMLASMALVRAPADGYAIAFVGASLAVNKVLRSEERRVGIEGGSLAFYDVLRS